MIMMISNKAIVNSPMFAANESNMVNQYWPEPWQNSKPNPNEIKHKITGKKRKSKKHIQSALVIKTPTGPIDGSFRDNKCLIEGSIAEGIEEVLRKFEITNGRDKRQNVKTTW